MTYEQYLSHIYAEPAKEDLENIYYYIAKKLKEPQIAKNLVKQIKANIKELNNFPERFVRVNSALWKEKNMRHFFVKNYQIYYVVNN